MAKFDSYPFTNISSTKFVGKYEKELYEFEPGETKFLPIFLINGFTNQFIDWAVNTKEYGYSKKDGTFDKPRFLSNRKDSLIKQLTCQEFEIVAKKVAKKEVVDVVKEEEKVTTPKTTKKTN